MHEVETNSTSYDEFSKRDEVIYYTLADGTQVPARCEETWTRVPVDARHGVCCAKIVRLVGNFVDVERLGIVTANAAIVEGNSTLVRGPDVAFWSYARQPKTPEGCFEITPDLAVEVIAPSNTRQAIREKIRDYLSSGARAVWVVDPEVRSVLVYRSPDEAKLLEETAILDGAEILRGFHCVVSELFASATEK